MIDDWLFLGPGEMSGRTICVVGLAMNPGLTDIIKEKDMFGASRSYDPGMAARDKKIAELRRRLSLAYVSRNKTEASRLTRELQYLGSSW
jgi:hypothetical protein